MAAAALARGVAEPQRADFSRARAGPSLCRPAACCRAPIGAPQPRLILFLLLSDMLELHACSIAAKPCEPRLHERLLSSADISLKRVDGLFEPLDNNDVSTVKDLARLAAATTIQWWRRLHISDDEKPQATDVQGATPSARAPAGDQEGTVPALISSKSPTRHGCQANGALDGSNISSCAKDAGLDSSLCSRAQYLAAVTIQRAALPFITRRLSAAIAQLRVRYAAASSLGQTDILFQLAQRASGPTIVTEHTGKAAAGQMRGGEAASRASAKRRRACDSWSETDSGDVDVEPGADDLF